MSVIEKLVTEKFVILKEIKATLSTSQTAENTIKTTFLKR